MIGARGILTGEEDAGGEGKSAAVALVQRLGARMKRRERKMAAVRAYKRVF